LERPHIHIGETSYRIEGMTAAQWRRGLAPVIYRDGRRMRVEDAAEWPDHIVFDESTNAAYVLTHPLPTRIDTNASVAPVEPNHARRQHRATTPASAGRTRVRRRAHRDADAPQPPNRMARLAKRTRAQPA
jgi:hypothetical protein